MDGNYLIFPVFLLIAVYLLIGRAAVREVIKTEGRNPYSSDSADSLSSRFRPSADITKLVFDTSRPRADYPKTLRAKIFYVRLLFYVIPFFLITTFVVMLVF